MRTRSRLLMFGLLAAATIATAQNVTQIDFTIPVFNERGEKVWELQGSSATYTDARTVEITALHLEAYGDEDGQRVVEHLITSPFAVIGLVDRTASGPGALHAVGRGYDIYGENWTYDDPRKTLVIRQHVVVTLTDDIGRILP